MARPTNEERDRRAAEKALSPANLVAELTAAKQELINLNNESVDPGERRSNSEGIRKLILAITSIQIDTARAASLEKQQTKANDYNRVEDLAAIRKTLIAALSDPLSTAYLWRNMAADLEVPEWIAGHLVDPQDRVNAGLDAAPLVEKEEVMGIWTKPVPRRGAA